LTCRQGEDDSSVPVQPHAKVAVHLGERGLFVLVIEGDEVQCTTLYPISSGRTDRVIFEGDQEDRRTAGVNAGAEAEAGRTGAIILAELSNSRGPNRRRGLR
jgi:hypothetical protein